MIIVGVFTITTVVISVYQVMKALDQVWLRIEHLESLTGDLYDKYIQIKVAESHNIDDHK